MSVRSWLVATCMMAIAFVVVQDSAVAATSLRIAPLNYETTLKKGETQKGFVDIANPDTQAITVRLEVQAYRQVDNAGGLEFYANEHVASSVKLDLTQIDIGPREAMRVYFVLDSTKLPTGDVFGAIMASTVPKEKVGSAQSVRVGTLLMIVNQTPSPHQANVSRFAASWLQLGEKLQASVELTNPADPKSATGFFPSVAVAARPYSVTTVKGPLLFAGRTRSIEYSQTGSYFGPVYLQAISGNSTSGMWVFAVTGYWRWLSLLLAGAICAVIAWVHSHSKTHFSVKTQHRK